MRAVGSLWTVGMVVEFIDSMAASNSLSGVMQQRGCQQSYQQLERDLARLNSGGCGSKHPPSGEELLSVKDATRRKKVRCCNDLTTRSTDFATFFSICEENFLCLVSRDLGIPINSPCVLLF